MQICGTDSQLPGCGMPYPTIPCTDCTCAPHALLWPRSPMMDRLLVPMLLRVILGPGAVEGSSPEGRGLAAGGATAPSLLVAAGPPPPPPPPAAADPRLAVAALGQLGRLIHLGLVDKRSSKVRR